MDRGDAISPSKLLSKSVEKVGGYVLGGLLGEGGFGKVYKGLHIETGQFAAVKVMTGLSIKLSQIQQEIDILKRVEHPNIIKYLDCSDASHKGKPFIIFEFIENGSLKDIVENFGLFTEELAKQYLYQILLGLDFLHKQNILHRDIKAANILITKEGICKLADFGVAAEISPDDTVGAAGTLSWMAPEIFGGEITSKSDIWSIGCLVVELLTGSAPYQGKTQMEIIYNLLETIDVPLPEAISPDTEDFLTQCFQRDPLLRPSAQELLTHPWISGISMDSIQEYERVQRALLQNRRRRRAVVLTKPNLDKVNVSEKPRVRPRTGNYEKRLIHPLRSFCSVEQMDIFLEQQRSFSFQKINQSAVQVDFKEDYLISLSLAESFKKLNMEDRLTVEKLTLQRDKFLKQYLDQQRAMDILTKRQEILETKFSARQLASLYYVIGNIENLPQEAVRGVLMIKMDPKTKWRKRAVACLDEFFIVYDHHNTADPLEVYYLKGLIVAPLPKRESEYEHCFSIHLNYESNTLLILRAANNDILQKWMACFKRIQQGTQPRLPPPPIRTQFLSKTDSPKLRKIRVRPTSFSCRVSEPIDVAPISARASSSLGVRDIKKLSNSLGILSSQLDDQLVVLSEDLPNSLIINDVKQKMRHLRRIEAVLAGVAPMSILDENTSPGTLNL